MATLALRVCICVILMTVACAQQGKLREDVKHNKKYFMAHDAVLKLKSNRAVCGPNQFSCQLSCLQMSRVCDTIDDCQNGYDEQNCSTDCTGPNQFKCNNGHCTAKHYRCDNDRDCDDGSDEIGCGFTCPHSDFTCSNGDCVNIMWVCDGDNDCRDNSDEINCKNRTCSVSQFTCGNNKCIPDSYQCDGDYDCADHSDEASCTCDSNHFQCVKGQCIPLTYKCDGHNDCGDMSDEHGCSELHPGACVNLLTFEDCLRMNTTSYPICDNYADGHRLCRKFCSLCNA